MASIRRTPQAEVEHEATLDDLGLLVSPHVLFYCVSGDEVQILRVLHGKQDLRSIMQEETGQ